MNNSEILKTIKEIVIDVLDIQDPDTFKMTESSKIEYYPEWDSLAHINIITQIESTFALRFSLNELEDLTEINDFIKIINSKI